MKDQQNTLKIYALTNNGEEKFRGIEDSCFYKLQRLQPNSADWAIEHEGWKVEPLDLTQEETADILKNDPFVKIECVLSEDARPYRQSVKAKRIDTGEPVLIQTRAMTYSSTLKGSTVKASQGYMSKIND